jgi:leucyl-tRNA synthetase
LDGLVERGRLFSIQLKTSDPEYYKWTQWLFIQMFKKGLAYQKDGFVNWDPVDKTVLANEQVDSEGRSWRSGAKVERIRLKQWYLKITDYGEKLYKDLDTLDGWPDSVKELQKGWIGLSNGHIVSFKAANKEGKVLSDHLECFTSKLHTLPAVRFVAISPFHPLVQSILDSSDEIMKKQIESIRKKVQSKRETALKEVDELPDSVLVGKCIHPLTHKEVPLYISEYVLDDYGTGAVMGVPAGDERDKKLATAENISYEEGEHEGHVPKDTWGVPSQGLSLRDWLVSRQRYWGVPIPIIHCQSCGSVPVPEKDLPVLLPSVNEGHNWSSKGGARPLDNDTFKRCTCPQCGKAATRDIDTMDTFVDSSWYFLRFLDPHNSKQIFDKKVTDYMPIKAYIGGMEHAIKHLLYARFVHKFLYDLGFVSCNEPFENIITQGLVKGTSYRLKSTGKYITKEEASSYSEDELIVDVEKMSKSKFNGISPLEAIDLHGIDCLKLAMIFAGPVEKDITIDEKLINTMVGLS